MSNIYPYSELRNILKVGDTVRAVPGKPNPCSNLNSDGSNTGKITEVDDSGFYVDGCFHTWNESKSFLEIVQPSRPEITWDTLQVNDPLADKQGNNRIVLGVCGRVIFTSCMDQPDISRGGCTKEELIEDGFSIVQPSPVDTTVEMTVAEVSKLLGKNVKIVKE